MTEDEAKKILDFLCRRCNGFYHEYEKPFTDIATIDKKFLTMQFNRLCIAVSYMKNNSKKNSDFYSRVAYVWTSPSLSFYSSKGIDTHIYRVSDDVELSTKNILEMLFEAAKIYNIFIEQNIFIHRGESLEEVMVKADPEDV